MVKECSFLLLESTRRFHFAVFQNYFRVYCEVRHFIINCLFRMLSPYFWHRHTQVKDRSLYPFFTPMSEHLPTLFLIFSYLIPSVFIIFVFLPCSEYFHLLSALWSLALCFVSYSGSWFYMCLFLFNFFILIHWLFLLSF